MPKAASTFAEMSSAQHYTQAALDDVDNAARIEEWIKRVEDRERNNPSWNPNSSKIDPPITLTFGDVTGSTVSRDDYLNDGANAQVTDAHGVKVVLRYCKGIDPPFIVITSMPTA
ncbi:hypothetical protein ADK57_05725 [Streptomyces sp. MMG1533]|nr:hypothetical protein ADK57_05725 [Streptomyces sp. MMG1533]